MASEAAPSAGFIYILRPQVLINGERIIRIGSTTRTVAEKLRELEHRSMVSFEVVYSLPVEEPKALEKQLHARYANRRMAGGSEGFFHMEPEEVISEIEEVAEELSRSWSMKARNAEFSAYSKDIGATRFKTSMAIAATIIWALATAVLGFGAARYAPIPNGMQPYALPVLLILSAILVRVILAAAKHLIETRYFTQRFGPALDAKDEELREKYPLG